MLYFLISSKTKNNHSFLKIYHQVMIYIYIFFNFLIFHEIVKLKALALREIRLQKQERKKEKIGITNIAEKVRFLTNEINNLHMVKKSDIYIYIKNQSSYSIGISLISILDTQLLFTTIKAHC